jgi:hypothetical protein
MFLLNFVKLSISKNWEKKTLLRGLRRAVKPYLVQLKEGNCSCDHVLAWSLPNSMRFFFVSNTFTILELEASTPLPLLVELHATILLQPFSKKGELGVDPKR